MRGSPVQLHHSLPDLRVLHNSKELQQSDLKMFAHKLAIFCVVVIVVLAVSESEAAKVPAKAVAKIIGKLFAGASAGCLAQAAEHCKQHWRHAHAALNCGKAYLRNNKGRCAVGK